MAILRGVFPAISLKMVCPELTKPHSLGKELRVY